MDHAEVPLPMHTRPSAQHTRTRPGVTDEDDVQWPLFALSPRSRWMTQSSPRRPLLQPRRHPGLVQAGKAQFAVDKRAASE
jgi:hypothetical protein